jgi:hypothetical protein
MSLFQITTAAELKEWIKANLGHPCIQLEIEQEDRGGLGHINLGIEYGIDFFIRHNQHEGAYKDLMILTLQPGIHTYDIPDDICEAVQAQPVFGNGFTPFTSFDVGARESLVATTGWAQFDLVTYVAAQQYLGDVRKYIGKKYDLQVFPEQHKMRVYPTPRDGEERVVIVEVYRRQVMLELYNHFLARQLMVAKTREFWGSILGKDSFTLPGGGTVNGDQILAKAEKDIEKWENQITIQSAKPIISVG